MRLALATALTLLATAPPALAAEPAVAMDYQRKPVLVYGEDRDPIAKLLKGDLSAAGRFTMATAPAGADGQAVDKFVAAVGAARGKHGSCYVLVPSLAFGDTASTSPRIDKSENRDGTWRATAWANLECPYTLTVRLYDTATGKQVDSIAYTDVLERRFEYHYDDRTSTRQLQHKAHEMARIMAQEAGREASSAFATQAARAQDDLAAGLVRRLKEHPLFRLEVTLSGWSDVKERLYFNLGKDVRVGLDDGFKLMKGDRQIGFLKVRDLDAGLSGAQPLWLEETIAMSDRVIEAPKAMWNHGLRLGGGWVGAPLVTAGYFGEVNVGPAWFGASERYLTWDLAFASNLAAGGGAFNLGYAHKFYARRWATRLGLKAGVMAGVAGTFPLPGAALATGLEYHFNEHALWATDLDLAAYWPYASLANPGVTTYPLGPLARTGFTFLF